jgi:hypothetical protein
MRLLYTRLTWIWEFHLHKAALQYGKSLTMGEKRETVLAVHGDADGYWYIGAGRSIAEGPYRNPDQLLSVASDLLAAEPHWRIDVFDAAGNKIITYSSEELSADDLHPLRWQHRWSRLAPSLPH